MKTMACTLAVIAAAFLWAASPADARDRDRRHDDRRSYSHDRDRDHRANWGLSFSFGSPRSYYAPRHYVAPRPYYAPRTYYAPAPVIVQPQVIYVVPPATTYYSSPGYYGSSTFIYRGW